VSTLIDVRDLSIEFDTRGTRVTAVDRISFGIEAGSTLALVGESGSGKSVTAQALMRILPPNASITSGQILFTPPEGGKPAQDLVKLAADGRRIRHIRGRHISMIFQEPMVSLSPLHTIGDQVSEALFLHHRVSRREGMARTEDMLRRVGFPDPARALRTYPFQLSGGLRQRAMIAMALVCRPSLLIADEPTTALDVTIQAQILALIKELQREEGMGVLFITHDMGVVAEIADRTVVMLGGEVVEEGPTEAIFAEAKNPYTRSLIAAVPRLGTMEGEGQPQHFPIIDRETGVLKTPPDRPATVDYASKPVLSVRNLYKRFDMGKGFFGGVTGRVHAVENVSFDLYSGETLSLVGESGCGKSTTGRAIMRLVEPQGGSIFLGGTDILALDRERMRDMRRHIQMIFQDPFASLNPRIRVGDAIAEPYLTHKLGTREQARAKVADLLQRVGLDPAVAGRYPQQFSGGQRQRICIARALALEPTVIVADESVSGLDVSIKAQVVNLLLDLQQSMRLSYLFISHDMAVVERMSHKVAVMYLGEIVEVGPAHAVFNDPQHPYTRRLIAAVPVPDPARREQVRPVANDEIKSPIRAVDYVSPKRSYRTVSEGHLVQEWDGDWRM
jgi:peptide/nickel transport system ATP-binding protein